VRAAEANRFEHSCSHATGRLLSAVSASVESGSMLEIGTGCGVGAAWIAEGRRAGVKLVTVDREPLIADVAREVLIDRPDVEVVCADWRSILHLGPFELVFTDVGDAKLAGANDVISATAPRGIIVIDDLRPLDQWPEEWRGQPDEIRDIWLGASGIDAVEVRTARAEAVIVAVKH